ncbi:MAG: hypothetical protein ABSC29_02055 [Minisyncoccia bacterium]
MAIKLRRGENFFYAPVTGLLDKKEQKRADEIYTSAKNAVEKLNKTRRSGTIDILAGWHLRGVLINQIIQKFGITETEKKYFWMMLYDVSGMTVPDHIRKNDFHVASILANYPLKRLQEIGAWSMWREIIGSTKIGNDDRVARWVVDYIVEKKIKTRDQARPLLMAVRNRLKRIDASILSSGELANKLQEVVIKNN